MNRNGEALQYASDYLKGDKGVALAAARWSGRGGAFQYAADKLAENLPAWHSWHVDSLVAPSVEENLPTPHLSSNIQMVTSLRYALPVLVSGIWTGITVQKCRAGPLAGDQAACDSRGLGVREDVDVFTAGAHR